jgi:CSLREA domain-containing protein
MSHSTSRIPVAKLLIGLGLTVVAAVAALAVVLPASAGGDAVVTVNSISNTDDGDCEGAPNAGAGNCTLREAINAVNDGDADIIKFHPAVFAKAQPGVISLCNADHNLPFIERDVVIDSTDSGVVIDGGNKDNDCLDGPSSPATSGIDVQPLGNGLDFELKGGKNFEIRDISCLNTGIHVRGNNFSLGTISIDGVIIDNIDCDEGIRVEGQNLESLSVTNSEVSSNDWTGIAVYIDACAGGDCQLDESIVKISGNRIEGGVNLPGPSGEGEAATYSEADGVNIFYRGVVDSKITVGITENEVINGIDNGVEVEFQGCGSDSGFNVHVDDNGEINSAFYSHAVFVSLAADICSVQPTGTAGTFADETSDNFDPVVTVNGNGDIESQGVLDGVHIYVAICCEESDSSATVEVNDNGRITGEFDGVFVETNVCCGDDNVSDVSVNGNDEITGEGDDGVDINAIAGSASFTFAGAVAGNTGFDADDNVCTITVDGNDEIDGVGAGGTGGIAFRSRDRS